MKGIVVIVHKLELHSEIQWIYWIVKMNACFELFLLQFDYLVWYIFFSDFIVYTNYKFRTTFTVFKSNPFEPQM